MLNEILMNAVEVITGDEENERLNESTVVQLPLVEDT